MANFTLDPKNEFEAAVMQIVETHRVKAKQYGRDGEDHQNFYDIADLEACSPLQACDNLLAKHISFLKQHKWRDGESDPNYVADAYLDRAVYSLIALVLYRRETDADS